MDEKLREDLNSLVDGALDSERAAQLRAQIETHADVKAEFERLRRVRDLVHALPTARANVADSVREALPPESSSETATRGRVIHRWPWARLAAGGIAAVAALLLVAIALRPPATQSVSEESTRLSRLSEPSADAPVERGEAWNGIEEEEVSGVSDGAVSSAGESSPAGSPAAGFPPAGFPPAGSPAAESPAAESPAGGRLRKSGAPKAKALKKAASLDSILTRVERAGTVLSRAERNRYFAELASLKTVSLRTHLDKVGRATLGTARRSGAKKERLSGSVAGEEEARSKNPRTRELNLTAIDQEDGDGIVRALLRVFVAISRKTSNAASTRGTTQDRKAKESHLRVDATASEIASLESWLRRVGLLSVGAHAVVRNGGVAGRTGAEVNKGSRLPADAGSSSGAADSRAPRATKKPEPRIRLWIRVRYGPAPPSGSTDD